MQIDQTQEQWSDLNRLFTRPSAFSPEFEPYDGFLSMLANDVKVLVVGAGGLGCELLKDLALSGIKNITVIDMDTIDVTNLNRQFLFRMKDVGQYKAKAAADFVMRRCPGVNVDYHTKKIQDFDLEFYTQFQVIIAGLDNVEARRWLNQTIHKLVTFDEDDQPVISTYMIDGGTEGFQGQSRVIKPYVNACYECTFWQLPQQQNTFALCTLASTPRIPEHCIAYAFQKQWHEHFQRPVDKDSPTDMQWIFAKAEERAQQYGISGVNYKLTMGVVKNIIPAIASTNAIVSAQCVNETIKLLIGFNSNIDKSFYSGQTSTNISNQADQRKEFCVVCSRQPKVVYQVDSQEKLCDFVQRLKQDLHLTIVNIQGSDDVYLVGTGLNAEGIGHKLDMTFMQLSHEGLLCKQNQIQDTLMLPSGEPRITLYDLEINLS